MATATLPAKDSAILPSTKWLPLIALPSAVLVVGIEWPAWALMWALAFALYAGFKWLSLADFVGRQPIPSWPRLLSYLTLWPGMDADAFFDFQAEVHRPTGGLWLFAIAKISLGFVILLGATPIAFAMHPLAGGWTAMIGIAFILHFGVIHLLALVWRCAGVNVTPIMRAPILADSVSDFWSRRWNLAFRDLVHRFIFRPITKRINARVGTFSVFVVSGLIHDFVISLTAGGSYGLPTLYFLIQGTAMLVERKHMVLRGGITGRTFTACVVAAPMGLLFPPVFVERVVIPMLQFLAIV